MSFCKAPLARKTSAVHKHRFAHDAAETVSVLEEALVTVSICQAGTFTMVCTPQQLPELVLGHLYTQGYILSREQVTAIRPSGEEMTLEIVLNPPPKQMEETLQVHSTGIRKLLSGRPLHMYAPHPPFPWKEEWVYQLAEAFDKGAPLYRKTHAAHSCFLAEEDRLLCCCEDIGRHNAMDKAIGYALQNGVDLTKVLLYSSGRIPVDMMEKVIRCGASLIASNTVPTGQAIQLARQYNITLIGSAKPNQMMLYHDGRK